ncbi:MAG: tRNA (adenosine(37)-N6)-threonylcarbamoyltransferase complex ATPase subunit type 1 TsaE [Desulfoplanes sp.]|nr:tRNA (adenosine(37)-N6)-threonylcarbamoyltransferase complex ATPase subunit type 1 TsaE [Desulfoplanes sp.]MDD4649726.1 tRNA (adenosine(37)-N6)-threonylcarbamoyltransferase complex ATPase subunit type 1 TsaE [Desulfoplanes sp.]
MQFILKNIDDTSNLAMILVTCLQKMDQFPAILLQGDLGSGKTTMTRMLVRRLQGGDQAEVSSPSFNVMNVYPTLPETAHFDFYRMEGLGLDGTMEEYLYDPNRLSIVEWINYLPEYLWPDDYILMQWTTEDTVRKIRLSAQGSLGYSLMACLADMGDAKKLF